MMQVESIFNLRCSTGINSRTIAFQSTLAILCDISIRVVFYYKGSMEAIDNINSNLRNICSFAATHSLRVNPSKFEVVIFGNI